MLHAVAENNDERSPDTKNILVQAYKDADIPAGIEIYEGTLHGWCFLDSSVYKQEQAERARARMVHLFNTAFA